MLHIGFAHRQRDPIDTVGLDDAVALLIDFRFYKLFQISQRLLPTEIASLQRNGIWQALLDDI